MRVTNIRQGLPGVARLSLFGSVLMDRFGPRRDVDMRVEFLPARVRAHAVDSPSIA